MAEKLISRASCQVLRCKCCIPVIRIRYIPMLFFIEKECAQSGANQGDPHGSMKSIWPRLKSPASYFTKYIPLDSNG